MTYINASYQTGLQLLMAAGAASNSGSGTSANSGTTTSVAAGTATTGAPSQSSSTSSNSLDSYSASASIAELKATASATNGPQAGVMAAIVAALSTKNGSHENDAAAANAAFQANSQLSSQQLSDILGKGGSLVTGQSSDGTSFQTGSIADILNTLKSSIPVEIKGVDDLSQWVQNGMSGTNREFGQSTLEEMSSAQVHKIIANNQEAILQQNNDITGISNAILKGTLKIQNASDVSGLDYSQETAVYTATTNSESLTYTKTSSYNPSFFANNVGNNASNGYLTSIGNVAIYLSW